MPNAPKTPHRQVRIDDETWGVLGDLAEMAGTDRSALLRSLVRWYLRDGREPVRPSRELVSKLRRLGPGAANLVS